MQFSIIIFLAIGSLALTNIAPTEDNTIYERSPVLQHPKFNINVFRRCVSCSPQAPACPTCPDGLQCALSPSTCDTCASTSCVHGSDSSTSSGPSHRTSTSDISSILPSASATGNPTFTGAGSPSIALHVTDFLVIVVVAGVAVCLL